METTEIVITQPVFYILLVLSIKKSHGYEIMKKVRQYSDDQVILGPGTLYGALKRMLENDLIIEQDEDTSSRRRYYEITAKGIQVLSAEVDRISHAINIAKKSSLLPTTTQYHGA